MEAEEEQANFQTTFSHLYTLPLFFHFLFGEQPPAKNEEKAYSEYNLYFFLGNFFCQWL